MIAAIPRGFDCVKLNIEPSLTLDHAFVNFAVSPKCHILCEFAPFRHVAQLVEHYLDTVGVSGSSPLVPTISIAVSFNNLAFSCYQAFCAKNEFERLV